MTLETTIIFISRLSLVLLFLPFSAMDKILNFSAATDQAAEATSSRSLAQGLIFAGLFVEIVMSLCVLTGFADRLAAFVLAAYCAITAILFKQFWKTPDFRLRGPSRGRDVMWDFLKNFAVAGGFLTIAFGTASADVASFFSDPLSSTQPYRQEKAP